MNNTTIFSLKYETKNVIASEAKQSRQLLASPSRKSTVAAPDKTGLAMTREL